jgi:hypothetical protein
MSQVTPPTTCTVCAGPTLESASTLWRSVACRERGEMRADLNARLQLAEEATSRWAATLLDEDDDAPGTT